MFICRLCITNINEEKAIDLFNNAAENELVKIIVKYMQLQVDENDAISKRICEDCFSHLVDFDDFYNRIEKCQRDFYSERISCDADPTNVFFDSKDETEIENLNLLTTIGNTDTFAETFNINASISETQDSHDGGDQKDYDPETKADAEFNISRCDSSSSTTTENVLKSDERIQENVKQKSKKTKKGLATIKDNDSCDDDSKTPPVNHTNSVSKSVEELIQSYMQLKCELCGLLTATFTQLKHHFSKIHKTKGYMKCCGTRFNRPSNLAEHIRWHLEPDFLKCEICNKKMKSMKNFQTHWRNMHSAQEERNFECKECGKRFAHAFNLKMHLDVHKTENFEICKVCQKSFKTTHLLTQHIKKMHDDTEVHICHICGREYRFKPSFDRHLSEHQGIVQKPTDQCNVCGKWFMPNVIRSHMKKHNSVKVECHICHKSCPTEAARKAHLSYVHNTQPTFKCSFCDKTFKKKSVLKEHLGIHTGAKDHSCPHCEREFRSKANMYVHIKRDHFEEWKLAQEKRFSSHE